MLAIGDIHVYVSDFERALKFWADGLRLNVAEKERTPHSGFARLDFPDGGPSLRLFAGMTPWDADARFALEGRPAVRFDITTTDLDATLVRLIEYGGRQVDEIETYEASRVVTVADPDGNTFELLEIPAGDTPEA
ncbi:hypothetical protein LCGC14_2459360 [marine sediment metagenome]|uniref:VOC domain-containing protein n=1 Tax=marine sediment metagenome TaxID=412755 RepID=A0A0F9C1D5_9ZZZZ